MDEQLEVVEEKLEPLIIDSYKKLDALIAEHVMGWTDVSAIRWSDSEGLLYETPILHGKPYGGYTKQNVPYYSTDPRDAGDILSLLEGSCWIQVMMEPDINDKSKERYTEVNITYLDIQENSEHTRAYTIGKRYSAVHKSYPLALCLAALQMVLDREVLFQE